MIVNAPIRVWMVDTPGGYIEVSDLYIWIRIPNLRKRFQYRIEGKKLAEALKNLDSLQTVGKLAFWELTIDGEKLVVIEPTEDQELLFRFEVNLGELSEAIFYFVS